MKQPRRGIYASLLTARQLTHRLNEIDREANEMRDLLMKQITQTQGITEQLKVENQMARIDTVKNTRSAGEELVCHDLIFS